MAQVVSKEVVTAEIKVKEAQCALIEAQNQVTIKQAKHSELLALLQVERKKSDVKAIRSQIDALGDKASGAVNTMSGDTKVR